MSDNTERLRNITKIPRFVELVGDLGVCVLRKIANEHEQLQADLTIKDKMLIATVEQLDKVGAELATAKQESDTMWEGLNHDIVELQKKLTKAEEIIKKLKA